MREVELPSGATLKIQLAPFADGKELFQAVLEELKCLKIDGEADLDVNLVKDVFCAGFSSKKVEAALGKCLKRCLYNDVRLEKLDDIFEPEEARQDFMSVCVEVAMDNIAPFVKSLFAKFSPLLEKLKANSPA